MCYRLELVLKSQSFLFEMSVSICYKECGRNVCVFLVQTTETTDKLVLPCQLLILSKILDFTFIYDFIHPYL